MKRESARRNIVKITMLGLASVLLLGIVVFVLFRYKCVGVKKRIFIEKASFFSPFSEEEKVNINKYLKCLQVQNESISGFFNRFASATALDLYNINAIVSMASLIPEYDLAELSAELSYLNQIEYDGLDFLNLIYLTDICNKLNIGLDYGRINESFKRFYDEETKLFFIDGPEDDIHSKLVATFNVFNALDGNLDFDYYRIADGAQAALNEYVFSMNYSFNSMFNSGGDIICLLGKMGLQELIDEQMISEWIDYWERYYDSISIDSINAALIYSGFAEVKQVFDSQYGCERIYNYYCSLNRSSLSEIDDLWMLCNVLERCKSLDNKSVNDLITARMDELMNADLVDCEIDLRSTVFGVLLAEASGFDYDKEKVRNYVKENYDIYDEYESVYDKASSLYYNIMLDQMVNGYDQHYDRSFLQKRVNDLLSELDYGKENIVTDISTARRIVEIVSDLRSHGVDIDLNYMQLFKLRRMINRFYKDDAWRESALIIDAYIIDNALSMNIITQKELMEVYDKLTEAGGTRQITDETTSADICTTYLFFAMFNRIDEDSFTESQKEYILSTKIEEGIFSYSDTQSLYDLSTIAYGNSILGY